MELNSGSHFLRKLFDLACVAVGNDHPRNAVAVCGNGLLLETADRQHATAQRDLAGHGGIAANGAPGERTDDGGSNRDSSRGAILRSGACGNVHVEISTAVKITIDTQR